MFGVGSISLGIRARLAQLFQAIFTNRLQHADSRLASHLVVPPQKIVIHQRGNPIEHVYLQIIRLATNDLGRCECASACENSQTGKEFFKAVFEQVVAPGDGVA